MLRITIWIIELIAIKERTNLKVGAVATDRFLFGEVVQIGSRCASKGETRAVVRGDGQCIVVDDACAA